MTLSPITAQRRITKLVTMISSFGLVINGRACIFFPFMGADQHGCMVTPHTWPKCGNLNLVSMVTVDSHQSLHTATL